MYEITISEKGTAAVKCQRFVYNCINCGREHYFLLKNGVFINNSYLTYVCSQCYTDIPNITRLLQSIYTRLRFHAENKNDRINTNLH